MKNALLKTMVAVLAGLMLSIPSFAQLTAAEKKSYEKSVEQYKDGQYDKAIDKLAKIQDAHPFSEGLWQSRITMEEERYLSYRAKILTKAYEKANKTGKDVEVKDAKLDEYRVSMLVMCLRATLYADNQEGASGIIRRYMVDPSVDTAIGERAKELYDKGDEEFGNEKYNAAIKKYQAALAIDSNYYNAATSAAFAYMRNEDYQSAVTYFSQAARISPRRCAPYRYIAECYMELKQWENAKNACIDGILIYPDVIFYSHLSKIAEKLGKTFERHWGIRPVFPNKITESAETTTIEPWNAYHDAKDRIEDYCNDEGVITKKQSLTESKYLEVFSWESMLKKSNSENDEVFKNFPFARDMQKAGWLDCYCFISAFHYWIHGQYTDFSKKNADRIREYINTQLIK